MDRPYYVATTQKEFLLLESRMKKFLANYTLEGDSMLHVSSGISLNSGLRGIVNITPVFGKISRVCRRTKKSHGTFYNNERGFIIKLEDVEYQVLSGPRNI